MTSPPTTTALQSQRGVALIMVLLIVAIMSIVATHMSSTIQLNIQKASNRQQYQQAYWYALGGERLSRGLIEASLSSDDRIHLRQAWASPLLSYPIDGGSLIIQIQDQGACFNLNALSALATPQSAQTSTPTLQLQFEHLLQALDADPAQITELSEPLRDWLDQDVLPTGFNGAEDLYYTSQAPPYLPANGPLSDKSELQFIQGFRMTSPPDEELQELIARLKTQLCATPTDKLAVNVSTLAPEQAPVLSGILLGKIPVEDLKELLDQRPDDGYASVDDFWGALLPLVSSGSTLDSNSKNQLDVSSDFFLARIEVNYYDANLVLYTRIAVKKGKPVVYQRHYGALNG